MATIIDAIFSVILINVILLVIGTCIFIMACLRKRDLISYLPIYIFFLIGHIFFALQFVNIIFQTVGAIFYIMTGLSIFLAAFLEYNKLFIKLKHQTSQIKKLVLVGIVVSPIVSTIQFFIIFILIGAIIMLWRIYLKTRSTVKLLFMITNFGAIIGLSSQFVQFYDIELGFFLNNAIATVYSSFLLIIGIVAVLEQKFMDTIKIKNNLKDKYSHNLGNALHSIFLTYELIRDKNIPKTNKKDLYDIINNKIFEASDLVKEIRNL